MTMRVIDIAPHEAVLALLLDRLEKASSGERLTDEELAAILELDPTFRETATKLLGAKRD